MPKLFTVKIVAKLSTTDSLFEKLSRHADISFFGPLKVEEATITKFNENSTIQVISIPVIDSNKVLEAFYSTDEDGFFVTVFEKVGTINNKGQFTGTNYLRSR